MANLVTLARILLLLIAARLFYPSPAVWQLANFFLIIVIFVSDGLDGYIARKRNETSLFGALFDIAGDRIVELTLWIVVADNELVPIWVPLVIIVRGVIVDTIRASSAVAQGIAPFSLMRTPLGKFIVASRFMRSLYAVVKAAAFAGLALMQALSALPDSLARPGAPLWWLIYALVYSAVVLCVARGLPVVVEFIYSQRHEILKRPGRKQ